METSLIYFIGGFVEECNGHTGIKQGCGLKMIKKGLSEICSVKLTDTIEFDIKNNFQYKALK